AMASDPTKALRAFMTVSLGRRYRVSADRMTIRFSKLACGSTHSCPARIEGMRAWMPAHQVRGPFFDSIDPLRT
ncbi:MAG TPA: hypothetical protein VIJ35_15110, partial [Bradyrhizobium sp.]